MPRANARRLRLALPAIALTVCGGCASLPKAHTSTPSVALSDTADTTSLGRAAARRMSELKGPSGIRLLPRGPDAFLARLTLVDLAERSLDLQYHLWHDDTVGRLLLGAVMRAADRGVRVRLLVDDVGTAPDDRTLLAPRRTPQHRGAALQSDCHPVGEGALDALGFLARQPPDAQQVHHR